MPDHSKKCNTEDVLAKADALYQKGLCDSAVDLLLAAIKERGDEKEFYFKLVEILVDSERFQNALDMLAKMPAGCKTGHADPSCKIVDDSLKDSHVKKLFYVGLCKAELQKLEEVQNYADRIFASCGDSAAAMHLKGLVLLRRNELQAAEIILKRAVARDAAYGAAYSLLGTISWSRKQFTEAFDFYEKGFIHSPTRRKAALGYHDAVVALGMADRGEKILRQALAKYPYNKMLRYLLIDLLLRQSKNEAAMHAIQAAMVDFGLEEGLLQAALKIRQELKPRQIAARADGKATVSLCMIVKDEEKDLPGCLQSIKALVDEMIVVDTGSKDRSRQIARAFGARVYDFEWCEDFSKARNFSLENACADWIFILDADERISARDYQRFKDLVLGVANEPVAYAFETRNYTLQNNLVGWTANDGHDRAVEAGTGWFPSIKVRLFPNGQGIRFQYPVHEIVEPSLEKLQIAIKNCDVAVHHYGKLQAAKNGHKGHAYYRIGMQKLDEMGDNIIALRELAVQAGMLGKHTEALKLWQRLIRLQPAAPEPYLNLGTAYWQLNQYGKALECAQKALALKPGLKEAHFNYAINLLHLGDAGKAISVLENLLEQHPQYLSARFMLSVAYCCTGDRAKGSAGFEKVLRTQVGPALAVSFYDLGKRLVAAGRHDYAVRMLEAAVAIGAASDDVITLLKDCRVKAGLRCSALGRKRARQAMFSR